MATIYRKTVTRPLPRGAKIVIRNGKQFAQWQDRKGKTRTAELTELGRIKQKSFTYTAKYRAADGSIREVSTGCRDKQAAQSKLKEFTDRETLVQRKVITVAQANISDHQDTLLVDHIADLLDYHRLKKTHKDRIKTYETRLAESAEGCGFRRLCDLSSDKLERWLGEQLDGERNMGASVYNGYIEGWNNFGNWCIGKRGKGKRAHCNGEKRLLTIPFQGMGRLDEKADRRRKARALTENELIRLLSVARQRPLNDALMIRRGKNKGQLLAKVSDERKAELVRIGHERALIYKTAITTGLRKGELATLAVRNLSFGDVPFVKLQHDNEKNRKGSVLPIRSDVAVELRQWVQDKQPSDKVFYISSRLLDILDRDIEAAGIPKVDDDGYVVHVHALRHSFGTHLSIAGVAPRTAQAAMRHSSIDLTMNTYTDVRLLGTAEAVESLPSFEGPRTVAANVAPNVGQGGQTQSVAGNLGDFDDDLSDNEKTPKTQRFTAFNAIGPTGFEPAISTPPVMAVDRDRTETPILQIDFTQLRAAFLPMFAAVKTSPRPVDAMEVLADTMVEIMLQSSVPQLVTAARVTHRIADRSK